MQLKLDSKLDRVGNFSFIDFKYFTQWYKNKIAADFSLKNRRIT
jgi:hypothetical protein